MAETVIIFAKKATSFLGIRQASTLSSHATLRVDRRRVTVQYWLLKRRYILSDSVWWAMVDLYDRLVWGLSHAVARALRHVDLYLV